jgi:ATP-binding cassette subfamily F protein 3
MARPCPLPDRPELKPMEKESEVTLRFPDVEPLNPPILQINEVAFRYPNTSDYLFTNVCLSATLQSRICIVGENGAGKTTLLKIMTGSLGPSHGTVHAHRNLKFGYFSQHHVDQLDLRVCPVELLQNHFPGDQRPNPLPPPFLFTLLSPLHGLLWSQ